MSDQEAQPRDAASELASFGEELRREREIRGISLKEISDATKISKRFLDAIERNDHRTLPAPVFTRGFVREYARYVGLNAEEMVNRYNFAAANDDRIEKPPAVAKYPQTPPRDISPRPAPKRGIPPVLSRIDRGVIFALIIAAALAGVAYWAIQNKRQERERADATAVPVTTRRAPIVPAATPAPATQPDDSKLRLTLEVTANSWVTLEADGSTVLNTEVMAGDKRDFEATDEFKFRTIGNAAGVSLVLNGARVPALGEDGEVVKNRVFDRNTLAELRGPSQPQENP
ncbi:MAG TPA: helix-turn-helix domain-containing protein [Thermoanaerobaculia bacterium]|nr:helix-turn-helix domain-containing protein [Thermoanaerobaculia bacterium]